MSRRSKALTIIPVALLSGAWTASLVTTSATAAGTHSRHHGAALPDGTKVPTQAIQAPASVPVPGAIAPGVPDGTADSVINGASTNGIPSPALAAYQRAAQIIDTADKGCNIPWELIAAIGRVESDHGQYGGNHLTSKGIAEPGIYGPVLDGANNTQAVPDTDGGLIDHDPKWDRAVGPMQFIPSTWSVVKVDADGDGQRNPQDINDAALATAVYLCSGNENLSTHDGQEKAVYRYNHSQQYVDLVLRLMEAYSEGDYTAVPAGTSAGTLFTPDYASAVNQAHRQHVHRAHAHSHTGSHTSRPGSSSTPTGSSGSTGGGTGGSTGGGSGSGTGSLPSSPSTPTSGGGVLGGVLGGGGSGGGSGSGGSGGGGGGGTVTQPAEDLITAAEAATLCSNKLGGLSPVLKAALPGDAEAVCESKLTGQPQSSASTLLNDVVSLLLG
ncbi:MAG TPA: lytic murein transglycosylase [Marmoricola sp.]